MAKFCKFCDKGFSNNRPLDNHYQGVHSYCMQCDLKFDQKAQFTKHMREIHQKVKATVTCKFCNLELKSKIINHYRAIHFYCSDECDLQFDTKPEILEHLETSHSNEAFKGYMGEANKCNLCEHKTRKSQQGLKKATDLMLCTGVQCVSDCAVLRRMLQKYITLGINARKAWA